jgi:3-methyl-2-oxobutanoate hydroxymethyltransferase
LDGRVRSVVAAIGYLAAAVDDPADRYANVASIALIAIKAFSDDVRAARQIRGAVPGARKP